MALATTFYLGDAPAPSNASFNTMSTRPAIGYPLPKPGTVKAIYVDVSVNTYDKDATVRLFKSNADTVPPRFVTIPAATPGVYVIPGADVAFAAGEQLDLVLLRDTDTDPSTVIRLSALMEMTSP